SARPRRRGDRIDVSMSAIGPKRTCSGAPHMSALGVKRTWKALQHSRQIRTPRSAPVTHIMCRLLRAVGGDFVEPIDDLCVAATLFDQTLHLIATGAAALGAVDIKHIELADQIAEDDCAVAGHFNGSPHRAAVSYNDTEPLPYVSVSDT